MMIEVAWQVYGWYQKNADTRETPVLNAGTRGMIEKCPVQLGLEKVSSADLPRM